jgi:hypothetical protein
VSGCRTVGRADTPQRPGVAGGRQVWVPCPAPLHPRSGPASVVPADCRRAATGQVRSTAGSGLPASAWLRTLVDITPPSETVIILRGPRLHVHFCLCLLLHRQECLCHVWADSATTWQCHSGHWPYPTLRRVAADRGETRQRIACFSRGCKAAGEDGRNPCSTARGANADLLRPP